MTDVASIVRVIHESFRDTTPPGDSEQDIFGPGYEPGKQPFMEINTFAKS